MHSRTKIGGAGYATAYKRKEDEESWRVIQYASRVLNGAEKEYSQIELEMLAVDFGCRKFHIYLWGSPFVVVSDHKPLEVIFNNARHTTSLRLQRILVRLIDYDFTVTYSPGKYNISDYTSRHPVQLHGDTRNNELDSDDITAVC